MYCGGGHELGTSYTIDLFGLGTMSSTTRRNQHHAAAASA